MLVPVMEESDVTEGSPGPSSPARPVFYLGSDKYPPQTSGDRTTPQSPERSTPPQSPDRSAPDRSALPQSPNRSAPPQSPDRSAPPQSPAKYALLQSPDRSAPPQSPDAMTKADKSLIAYGVKYLKETPDRPKLLKINSRSKLTASRSRKSLSDYESGFESIDSASASGSSCEHATSPTSSEASDTLDSESHGEEESWTESEYPFQNLAMSGGGAKGYAYIGALKALQDAGVLPEIRRIVGTSAGAVIGGMLAVCATPQEIADFFSCDVKKLFQDKNTAMCLFLPRLLTKFGLNSGQRFYEIFGDFLAKKTGDPDITFLKIYRVYRKELCVTVTNLSRMRSEYCHYTTTPELSIRTAIKISMAFPGVYESMKTDLLGNGTDLYVDGGTLENFPVQYFDEIDPDTDKPIFNEKTMGLYLMSEDQFSHKIWQGTFQAEMLPFPSYLPNTKLARDRLKDELKKRKKRDKSFKPEAYMEELKKGGSLVNGRRLIGHYSASNKEHIEVKGPKNYFKAMLSTLLLSQKHMLVQPSDLQRTVGINLGYIDTKDTVIEPGDREFMICQGYEHTRNFLQHYLKKRRHKKHSPQHRLASDALKQQTSAPGKSRMTSSAHEKPKLRSSMSVPAGIRLDSPEDRVTGGHSLGGGRCHSMVYDGASSDLQDDEVFTKL